MDYFKIDLRSINAGFNHQFGNFLTIIKYCYFNNKKMIKPIFKLDKKHNKNKKCNIKTDFSKYIQIDKIKVNNAPFKLYDDNKNINYTISRKKYKYGLLKRDDFFKNIKHANIQYQMTDDIVNIGNYISNILGDDYMCIHVRRGDKLKKKQMVIDTEPESIKKMIDKYDKKQIYIMTNNLADIKPIRDLIKDKEIYFFDDFENLKNIKDNYYLYCIENEIMKNASIRCSTFNVKKKRKCDTFYHCYLTNFGGWQ